MMYYTVIISRIKRYLIPLKAKQDYGIAVSKLLFFVRFFTILFTPYQEVQIVYERKIASLAMTTHHMSSKAYPVSLRGSFPKQSLYDCHSEQSEESHGFASLGLATSASLSLAMTSTC
ncbi:MAG: hypothetical protein AYP45_13610 [Candidatus Brocadia carolinensis]|uniref:Uncharacterized protein n=1 Tax=Candidatus Brocadia carolinensis TaxID=1004156 RepID=A0A1V4ARD8_9BACT|nr:MAG: hypothetical protein AYP45_13610 [Candidatus Brocadia caroliniensis]